MSYETESNKNGISKATNKLFFGSKIKKANKKQRVFPYNHDRRGN
jgi:hypothetical protein